MSLLMSILFKKNMECYGLNDNEYRSVINKVEKNPYLRSNLATYLYEHSDFKQFKDSKIAFR